MINQFTLYLGYAALGLIAGMFIGGTFAVGVSLIKLAYEWLSELREQ